MIYNRVIYLIAWGYNPTLTVICILH